MQIICKFSNKIYWIVFWFQEICKQSFIYEVLCIAAYLPQNEAGCDMKWNVIMKKPISDLIYKHETSGTMSHFFANDVRDNLILFWHKPIAV